MGLCIDHNTNIIMLISVLELRVTLINFTLNCMRPVINQKHGPHLLYYIDLIAEKRTSTLTFYN